MACCAELRQPRPADGDTVVGQALALAVERQVVGKLVDQHCGDEAHIGAATVDHPGGCRRAVDRLRVAALDDRAHVLEDHVAARALRQAVAHLLADHLELVGGEALGLGVGERDRLDRDARLVEEQRRRVARGVIGGAGPAGVGGDVLGRGRRRGFGYRNSPRFI